MTKHQPSPELKAFLTDWLHWAENGAAESEPYFRRVGLCTNASLFQAHAVYACVELREILDTQFNERSVLFPFGEDAYTAARAAGTQHLDPDRLAWVRAQL